MTRLQAATLAAGLAFGFGLAAALAAKLPAPAALGRGAEAATVRVIEPHESLPGRPAEVAYRAFPAPVALAAALGPDWARGGAVEFRALDGFVVRVDAGRLAGGRAFLAFARADGKPFTVDNVGQNEKDVPLGPWYLIWDDSGDPARLAAGASDWPYQADEVFVVADTDAALRPPGLDPALGAGLALAKTNCLTCHKVNGWGGDKAAGDLARLARQVSGADLVRRALDPRAFDPNAAMPALMAGAPEAARRAAAEAIAAYLSRVPPAGR